MENHHSPGSTHLKPFAAFNTFINVLMASGPILLPIQVAAAGYGYSMICLIICCIISVIACDFIIETLAICNYQNQIDGTQVNQAINVNVSATELEDSVNKPKFHIKEQFEYGSMGKMLYGKYAEIFIVIVIVIYLYGALISKGIMVGNSLSSVFEGYAVVENYSFWVGLFFFFSAILSFKDVASIQIVQSIVAIVRYITILSMVIGASQVMLKYQVMQPTPWFQSKSLPQLISTAVFAYLMHHSSPGMLRPIRPQSAIRTIIMISFGFGLLVFLLIPLTGIWAFPGLNKYCFYNIVYNQDGVRWAYYIISFYMFLNIAALPVLTITIRKNMMKVLVPHLMPKNSLDITKASAGFTLLIVIPCALLSIVLKDDIEIVVGFTGGVCGVLILLIFPAMLVLKGRQKCPTSKSENPFRSAFHQNFYVYALLILGCIFIPYNLYIQISKLTNSNGGHCLNKFDPNITHY